MRTEFGRQDAGQGKNLLHPPSSHGESEITRFTGPDFIMLLSTGGW
ncbi:MAG: hypothetical protein WA626_09605 [Acidobacteriaceae bacterium]